MTVRKAKCDESDHHSVNRRARVDIYPIFFVSCFRCVVVPRSETHVFCQWARAKVNSRLREIEIKKLLTFFSEIVFFKCRTAATGTLITARAGPAGHRPATAPLLVMARAAIRLILGLRFFVFKW